jgi:hypothetical protein
MDERSRNMMKNPNNWPIWPVLPIKNHRDRKPGQFPRLGALIDVGPADGTPEPHFVEGCIYQDTTFEGAKAAPKADIDKLIADGWVVD